MTLGFFDDFLGSSVDTGIWGVYTGTPGGTNGYWLPDHITVGGSICNLNMYYDTAGGNPSGNYWVGGGMGSWNYGALPVGSTANVAMRLDPYSAGNITGIALFFAYSGWPPEIDFFETPCTSSGAVTSFTATSHYGSGNSQIYKNISNIDVTQWHVWGCEWTSSTISYTLDGSVWASLTNPDTNVSDPYSLVQQQIVSLQIQIGDPGTPATNTSITSSNPVRQQIDWVQVCLP
jgi:beta-glucanase (GH16 family)